MKRWLPIAACVVAAAGCLMPTARSAELVTLRNGFQMRCDRHAAAGGSVRIYFTAGNDNYIELPPSQIASVSQVPSPAATPEETELTGYGKTRESAKSSETHPSGPEGRADLVPVTHGLKPVPFSERSSASGQAVLTSADLRQMLAKAGRNHNLDVDLLASVVHAESGGNPRAVSQAGARGLMQLMPTTAAALGVEDSFQPQENVGGGSAYLDFLLARYSDNLALALAAYNAGPEAVDRYRGIPPYPETRAYVARVIHEFNRRVLARRAAAHPLPHKLQAAVSQK